MLCITQVNNPFLRLLECLETIALRQPLGNLAYRRRAHIHKILRIHEFVHFVFSVLAELDWVVQLLKLSVMNSENELLDLAIYLDHIKQISKFPPYMVPFVPRR